MVDSDGDGGHGPGIAAGGDVDGGDPHRDHPLAVGVLQRSGHGDAGKIQLNYDLIRLATCLFISILAKCTRSSHELWHAIFIKLVQELSKLSGSIRLANYSFLLYCGLLQ